MAINKVVYGNNTLIDLTEDTVSANNLLAGETAHDRSGAPIVGSVVTAEVVDNLTTQDATKALSANQGYVLNQNKVDKVVGKGLSTNDYTNEDKAKVTSSDSKITNYEDRGYLGKNKLIYNAWKSVNIQHGTAVFENNGVTLTATANDCYTGYATEFPTDARIPISEGETITISWKETSNKSGLVIIFPNATITGAVYVDNANAKSLSYTATSGVTFVTFRFGVQNSGNTIEYKDIQIEYGSTATSYEAYVKSNVELDAEISTKIDKTASEIQTSDGQFTTVTGGLMQSCVVGLEPIQSGSGTPSPSNVRAISGHTQVQVENVGKNLLKVTASSTTLNGLTFTVNDDGSIKISGTATANTYFYPFGGIIPSYLVGKSVIVNGSASGVTIRIWHYNGTNSVQSVNGNDSPTVTISTTDGAVDAIIWNNTTVNTTIYPMLRLATDSATFEPYKGYTTTINLGGTYYGGTLDAVSGKLTVNKAIVDLGTLTYGRYDTQVTGKYRYLSDGIASTVKVPASLDDKADIICSNYDAVNGYAPVQNIQGIAIHTNGNVMIYDETKATLTTDAFKSAMNGVQLAYELATPQTIQLTPKNLETLVGQNNVFAPLQGQTLEEVEFREVLAIDDVPKAIPYENVAPDMGTGENRTYFRIKKYGRLVQLEFIQSNYWMVVEQQTKVVFGVLPDGYYDKQPSSMLYPDVEFEYPFVNETATNQYDNRKLFINMVNGEVYSVYQANDVIHPMGNITYILHNN